MSAIFLCFTPDGRLIRKDIKEAIDCDQEEGVPAPSMNYTLRVPKGMS